MLPLDLPKIELYDGSTQTFYQSEPKHIELEHSLHSLSEWESKWHKPFLTQEQKTNEEMQDYIRCMTLTPGIAPLTFVYLPETALYRINKYIEDPATATWFSEKNKKTPSRKTVTAELIYYWMIQCNIPFECQYWHLNKLLTLIRVCDIENSPKKKMSKGELMRRNTALNAARRQSLNTRG